MDKKRKEIIIPKTIQLLANELKKIQLLSVAEMEKRGLSKISSESQGLKK